jgi:hypothetical protein
MQWRLGALVCLVAFIATSCAAAEAQPASLLERLSQTWQLKVAVSGGGEAGAAYVSESTATLHLQRSLHFENQVMGKIEWPGAVAVDDKVADEVGAGKGMADAAWIVRIDGSRRNNRSAVVTLTTEEADATTASDDALATPAALASLKLDLRTLVSQGHGFSASGSVRLGAAAIKKHIEALQLPRTAAKLLGLAADREGAAGTFTATFASASTLTLTLHLPAGVVVTVTGAGDLAPPMAPWWQRYGPSAAMFAVFMVVRTFQSFLEERQTKKRAVQQTLAAQRGKKADATGRRR